jgi:hypothetical protein
MANKRLKPEEIVSKLRQVEVLTGQGMARLDAIRQIGVSDVSACGYLRGFSIRRVSGSS